MLESVVTDDVDPAVLGIAPEVVDVDLGGCAADKCLKFWGVEHGEPRGLDHGGESAQKGGRLKEGLVLQAVACDIADVY